MYRVCIHSIPFHLISHQNCYKMYSLWNNREKRTFSIKFGERDICQVVARYDKFPFWHPDVMPLKNLLKSLVLLNLMGFDSWNSFAWGKTRFVSIWAEELISLSSSWKQSDPHNVVLLCQRRCQKVSSFSGFRKSVSLGRNVWRGTTPGRNSRREFFLELVIWKYLSLCS